MAEVRERQRQNGSHFLYQGIILAAAMVITKIIGVLYRIPLTNILGDEGNGFYGYAFEVYAMTLILSSLSLPTAVSKLVSERMARGQKKNAYRVFLGSMGFAIVVGLFVAILIFTCAGSITRNLMESPLSVYALKVLASGLFIVAILGVLRGFFQGLGNMVPTAASQILEQIVNAVVSLIGASALYKAGVEKAAESGEELLGPAYGAAGGTLGTVAGALSALIFLIIAFYFYKGVIRRQVAADKSERSESYGKILKVLLLTIIPVIFSTAIYNINQILDLTIFNKMMAAQGYVEKEYMALQGIYTGKYNTLINVPLAMANGLAAAVIPSITAAVAMKNRKDVHEKIGQTIRFTMVIAIPCFVGFIVLASPLMVFLYNDASTTPARLLSLGSITVVLYCWSTVTNSILQGLDKMSVPAKNAAICLVIHLIALVIMLGLFKWNIYAIVGSNIVFSVCMCYLNVRAIYRTCGYSQEVARTFIRPLIASVIMGVITYIVYIIMELLIGGRVLPTLVSLIVAIIVYVVLILRLQAIGEEDLMVFPAGGKMVSFFRKMGLM